MRARGILTDFCCKARRVQTTFPEQARCAQGTSPAAVGGYVRGKHLRLVRGRKGLWPPVRGRNGLLPGKAAGAYLGLHGLKLMGVGCAAAAHVGARACGSSAPLAWSHVLSRIPPCRQSGVEPKGAAGCRSILDMLLPMKRADA